jgi:hypothetical protein
MNRRNIGLALVVRKLKTVRTPTPGAALMPLAPSPWADHAGRDLLHLGFHRLDDVHAKG